MRRITRIATVGIASAALALSATVGCGFTAQLGAMRISEEVDALEVMGVPSLPFLVTTRMIAGLVAVVPLYVIGLLSSYVATRTIATVSSPSPSVALPSCTVAQSRSGSRLICSVTNSQAKSTAPSLK